MISDIKRRQEDIMKKKYLLAVCLCITFLAGCEKTPDEVIVKEKGAGNISQYESGEKTYPHVWVVNRKI